MPNNIPFIIETINRTNISTNTIILRSHALSPRALNILYISASSLHLPKV